MQHSSLYVIVLLLLYAPVVSQHTEIVFVTGHHCCCCCCWCVFLFVDGTGGVDICQLFVLVLCSHLMQHNSLFVIVLLLLYGMSILLVFAFHLLWSFIAWSTDELLAQLLTHFFLAILLGALMLHQIFRETRLLRQSCLIVLLLVLDKPAPPIGALPHELLPITCNWSPFILFTGGTRIIQ